MDLFGALDAFVQSAELGSFSSAARRLGLTPAAVSKQVALLEKQLGARLFQRSTRSLALTEAGERLLADAAGGLEQLRRGIANVSSTSEAVSGVLRISVAPAFGRDYVLPLMPAFLARYPLVAMDWHLDNRRVDLIREHFDAAIGGGVDLAGGQIARPLAPLHLVLVAAPAYLGQHPAPRTPADLLDHQAVVWRSPQTGRTRPWALRSKQDAVEIEPPARMTLSDPEAVCQAAVHGLGIALVGLLHALPHLENGGLVRILPDWFVDGGAISIYYTGTRQLPAKTRHFIDYLLAEFEAARLPTRLSANGA